MSKNRNETKINFYNHRNIWKTDAFLRKAFNIKEGSATNTNYAANNFLHQLENIPVKEKYLMIGYGSLLNESDVPRTARSAENHRLAYVYGYERIFNIGYFGAETSFLNVRKAPEVFAKMPIAIVEISWEDLPNLITREGLYNFEMVEVEEVNGEKKEALMVIGDPVNEFDDLLPQLNYLHLCLTGAKDLGGLKVVNEFLNTTYCYDGRTLDFVSIKTWLNNMDVLLYMFKIEYSSR